MTFHDFKTTLDDDAPPSGVSLAVQALWYDANGDWDRAHALAQEESGPEGAWVHAYLHRKEGDLSNASYWYRRAGQERSHQSLNDEWEHITQSLLNSSS